MSNKTMKIEFEITSYNLLDESDGVPTEMKLLYVPDVNLEDNFLSVVDNIVSSFRIEDTGEFDNNYYLCNIYEELWSEHFKGELLNKYLRSIDKHDYSKLDITIKELNEQFNLSNKRIKLIIPCNGGNGDMKFFFHINRDKQKIVPHIHCRYCGIEAEIDLNKVEFMKESFHSRRISQRALNIVQKYQQELIEYFNKIEEMEENVKFTMIV